MDVSKLRTLGWKHKIDLRTGLGDTYKWFIEHYHDARGITAA